MVLANGYRLQRAQPLHQEAPTVVGAPTDVVQTGVGLLFTLVVMLGRLVSVLVEAAPFLIGVVGLVLTLSSAVMSDLHGLRRHREVHRGIPHLRQRVHPVREHRGCEHPAHVRRPVMARTRAAHASKSTTVAPGWTDRPERDWPGPRDPHPGIVRITRD